MSEETVRREQDAEAHLLAAAEFIAIAESGDAERSAYEHAAIEIEAAMQDDPSLTQREVGRRIGKSDHYVRRLLRALAIASDGGEFRVDWQRGAIRRQDVVEHVANKRPEAFAAAFDQAPPEAKRQIIERIAESPELRVEVRKRDNETTAKRRPSPVQPRTDHNLYEFESRLVSARRDLREALALIDRIDSPGDDEDILDLLRDCEGLLSAAAEAYRSGKSIDTWAWELYERSAD